MADIIWETPDHKRQAFEDSFFDILKNYKQILDNVINPISWDSEQEKPIIDKDLIQILPLNVTQEIEQLQTDFFNS